MGLLDNSLSARLGALDKRVGVLDERVDQLDKGMVQIDHGLNRLDKEMIRFGKGMDQLNKGMNQLNKDVDERERDLTLRLSNLKAKLESDHALAMGEVAELLQTHSYDERSADQAHAPSHGTGHPSAGVQPYRQDQPIHPEPAQHELLPSQPFHHELSHHHDPAEQESQPERARAISALSAALGPQAPVIEDGEVGGDESPTEHARAVSELAALLGTPRRDAARSTEPRDPMQDEPDRYARAHSGQAPPLDFAAILEHIRNREAVM